MVPEELVGIKKQGATWYQNVPEASPKCGDSGPDGSWSAEMVDMATWVLADCGEGGLRETLLTSEKRIEPRLC